MTRTKISLRVRNAVARGAALLDRARPGWAREIKPERLDLASCRQCVLGQVYRRNSGGHSGFVTGLEKLGLSQYSRGVAQHGFQSPGFEDDWDGEKERAAYCELDKQWLFEIGRRVNGRFGRR